MRATWRLCGLTTALAAAQAVVLAFIAHDAMALVFGDEFRVSGGTYLQILLVGTVLGASILPVSNYLTNHLGRPLLALALAGTTLAVAAVVCLVTIPRWGASRSRHRAPRWHAGIRTPVGLAMLIRTGRAGHPDESAMDPATE
ncbi:MAG: hypothetical protein R2878_14325 [Thermoleophilia bacterium]